MKWNWNNGKAIIMSETRVLSSITEKNAFLWVNSEEKNIMVAYNNFQGSEGATSMGRAQWPLEQAT